MKDHQQHIDIANKFLIQYNGGNQLASSHTVDGRVTLLINWQRQHIGVHWVDTNPHAVTPFPLYDAKVTVRCSTEGTVGLGQYFFEKETPTGFPFCSVGSFFCAAMLQSYVILELLQ